MITDWAMFNSLSNDSLEWKRGQLSLSPFHIISIHQEHGQNDSHMREIELNEFLGKYSGSKGNELNSIIGS